MRRRYLLAADVGGTKVALALATAGGARPEIVAHRVYACQEFDGLQPIIAKFLQQPQVAEHREAIAAACFSVAGPVAANSATLTNLDWKIAGNAFAAELRLPEVRLINDFSAAGLGITRLATAGAENKIPQRIGFDALQVPRAPQAGEVERAQYRIVLQLQQRVV